jgi:hypothetical protein
MPMKRLSGLLMLVLAATLAPADADATTCPNTGVPGTPYQGFGASTTGGAGRPVYRVTHLGDAGPGSLRDALSRGDRCIVFDTAGDIDLRNQIYVKGGSITVDGFTAPAPGITLRDHGISIWGNHGASNVILRGLRYRNSGEKSCASSRGCYDGIQIKNGARRVVIDHISSDRAPDGALDITGKPDSLTQDVTVQWSIISGTTHQSLIHRATRVSMHHNLFIDGQNRNPQADWDSTLSTVPPDVVLDFRNNVIWNFSAYGTIVRRNATANVVDNYYYSAARPNAARALVIDRQGRAHAAGNFSGNGVDVNALGTATTPFPAASISTTDSCTAVQDVADQAGARGRAFGLDAVDRRHIAQLSSGELGGCPANGERKAARRTTDDEGAGGSKP